MIAVYKQATELVPGDKWGCYVLLKINRVESFVIVDYTHQANMANRNVVSATASFENGQWVEVVANSAFILCKCVDGNELYWAGEAATPQWTPMKRFAKLVFIPPKDLNHISMTDETTYWSEIYEKPQ